MKYNLTILHIKYLVGITLMVCMLTGCETFKRNDPSSVGIFYPNQPIHAVYLTKADFWNSKNIISFSGPAEIKAVGKRTRNSLIGDYYETALISPKLDHCQGDYWIGTDGDYYATISWLQSNGKIEYTGSKTSSDYFWEGVGGFLVSTFGIVIEISLIIIIAISIYKRRASKSSSISLKTTSSSYDGGSYSSDSYSSYSSEYDSKETYESDEGDQESEVASRTSGTRKCQDCQNIDLGGLGFTSKGNGRCKECDGTGHDNLTEAIAQLGSFGSLNGKYDCKTCHGTGQCQTCGGTGIVYY